MRNKGRTHPSRGINNKTPLRNLAQGKTSISPPIRLFSLRKLHRRNSSKVSTVIRCRRRSSNLPLSSLNTRDISSKTSTLISRYSSSRIIDSSRTDINRLNSSSSNSHNMVRNRTSISVRLRRLHLFSNRLNISNSSNSTDTERLVPSLSSMLNNLSNNSNNRGAGVPLLSRTCPRRILRQRVNGPLLVNRSCSVSYQRQSCDLS